ncbi:hypothetical protein TcasGA2_TC009662 [Tribolium castaneum]|uniref:Uncharacterized protein n=1 Tax=Tribolium castaneum TaxID=7070 RepID=D6WTQ7_TRICA|nr:hypothetical protein TcasGA2_TC009662 [Tribolium castaneum]
MSGHDSPLLQTPPEFAPEINWGFWSFTQEKIFLGHNYESEGIERSGSNLGAFVGRKNAVIIRNGAVCCIKHEAYIFQDKFRHVRCTRTRSTAMNFITVRSNWSFPHFTPNL